MHENQERPVAADTRNRVIADCAALLPLARSACAAMDEGDETEVLRLFCGESQRKTLRRLGRLIDDLRLCRTASDLPGPEPEIVELRNASFKVFRGLSARVGNPLDLTKRFRSGAVDFFRMLIRRDPGRFNAIIFYQWAQTFRSLQNFRREAKKRAVLMNRPA